MINTILIKHSLITGFKFIIVLLAFLFVLTKCGGCDNKIQLTKTDNSLLYERIKADSLKISQLYYKIEVSEAKTKVSDSLKLIAEGKYDNASARLRDRLKHHICDTLEVVTVLNECDSVIDANHIVITQRDTTIKELKQVITAKDDMIDASRTIIANQDKDYKALEKESKKALRKQKFKTVCVIIGGVVLEALTIFSLR